MPEPTPAPADRLAAYLAEARERSEQRLGPSAMALPITNDATRALMASAADVPRLVAAIEAVLALHHPEFEMGVDAVWCSECAMTRRMVAWPCPTVQAITSKLLTEEETDGN